MGYKNIDACKYNCVLYWKENAQLDKCPECEESLPIQPLTTQPLPTQLPSCPRTVGSIVASAPASELPSCVRGVTRKKNATKLRRQLSHNISVPIPFSNHRPEGEHAPSLVNHLGSTIRQVASVRPHGWKKLDSGIKLAVIAVVQQNFDIGDYKGDMQLMVDIDRQCGVLYRSWKYELHSHYLELMKQGVPRPQDHPAEGCDPVDWQLMVSQCWESLACKAKSKKAQESRAKLPYNHTSGFRSFASRTSLMKVQNAGQAPPITQFFHDTHNRQKSNEWVDEGLVQRTEKQSQPSVIVPMIEEHIAVDVLGKASRYLHRYGIYTRTSSSSTQSWAPHLEVIALREQLAEQDRRTRALEAFVQQLAVVVGIDPTSYLDITRGTTSVGDGTATGDHDATLCYANYGLLAAPAEILKAIGGSGNPCILEGYDGYYNYSGTVYNVSALDSGSNFTECRQGALKALNVN